MAPGGSQLGRLAWRRREEDREDSRDPLADGLECRNDGHTGTWPFLVKRYAEGHIAVHLHFHLRNDLIGEGVNSVATDLCLSFKRADVGADQREIAVGKPFRREVIMGGDRRGPDEMQRLVAVLPASLSEAGTALFGNAN